MRRCSRTSTSSWRACGRSRPRGVYETRRLPGSGAGPDPARLLIGSEGTLGVITQAWMRLQDRPRFRASAPFEFERLRGRRAALRAAIARSGLWPANCRLLDHREALFSAAGDGTRSLLIVTFESADHALDAWFARAAEICSEFHGTSPVELSGTSTDAEAAHRGAAGAWRNAFIAGGHRHDAFVRLGLIMETFETAVTWDSFRSSTPLSWRPPRRQSSRYAARHGLVPVRLPVSRWPGAVLHGPRPGPAGCGAASSGPRSKPPPQMRCSPPAARSPTTTPSGDTTARGMTRSARRSSPKPTAPRAACSIPTASVEPPAAAVVDA